VRLVEAGGLVPVLRAPTAKHFRAVAEVLVAAGVRALEVTLTAQGAPDVLAALDRDYGQDVAVGAGTVLSADAAELCVARGASFLVAPTGAPDVVATAQVLGVAVFPGALTPTEVLAAHRAGADGVKLFPASGLRPDYVRDLHGPMPGVRLMPAGGIALADVGTWLGAGAFAVGVGSALLGSAVSEGPDRALHDRVVSALEVVARERSEAGGG
jgi:2-dehydro-3-deoxyphosphogluconate aldolase/(4S)-4-hydroxy-2-oxoglutarate aldolase